MLVIDNYHVIVPRTRELSYFMPNKITGLGTERLANEQTGTLSSSKTFALNFTPLCAEWIEVYINDVRVINPSYATRYAPGAPKEAYNIFNNTIVFSQEQTGTIKVISDTIVNPLPELTANTSVKGLVITVQNIQSYDTYEQNFTPTRYAAGRPGTGVNSMDWYNTMLRARVGDAHYAEPLVIRQPLYGYVRLTQDRKSFLYVPLQGFQGYDVFTYTLITQRGQIGPPACCRIEVFGPPPPASLTLTASAVSVSEGNSVVITLNSVGLGQGTRVPYTISGNNITVGDFFNFETVPGLYSVGARYASTGQAVSTVNPGTVMNIPVSTQNSSEQVFYTIEPSTLAAQLNITSLTGNFIVGLVPGQGLTGTDSFTANLYFDNIAEGQEVFTVTLNQYTDVNVSVVVEDLFYNYAIRANITSVAYDSIIRFDVDSRYTSELLYYTIENADGSPIPNIPYGYSITAVKL